MSAINTTAKLFFNGKILTPQGFKTDYAVVEEYGHIAALLPINTVDFSHYAQTIDLQGGYLLPGFIDVQVNGGGGVLFNNQTTVEAIDQIGKAHRKFGTTGFLPTLISDSQEVMAAAIAATEEAIIQEIDGVLGIHLEGPYLASERKGTHNAAVFRAPDQEEITLASSLLNGCTLITLAPECVPVSTIQQLVQRGAIVSAGHTAATYEQTQAGLMAGIRGFTHLFNAMSPLQGREPNVVGAALECPYSWCGIIVDGHHVHPSSLKVALAAKPRGKVFLVTDAMPPVGSDNPSYTLYGEVITVENGVVRNAAGTLAGSALDMATAVRNCVELLDVSLEEAARMASTYPAEFLGLGEQLGKIAVGYQADWVLMDSQLNVVNTWLKGR